MGRIYLHLVRKSEQLLMQRVIKHSRKLFCGHPGTQQIRTADVADEHRVAGQDGVRHSGRFLTVKYEDADRFRSMARRLEESKCDISHCDFIPFMRRDKIEFRVSLCTE